MRWFAAVAAVALGGCNWVFGLEAAGGGGDDDVAIDASDDGDGGADGSDGGGGAVVALVAGGEHTCVIREGRVRCWGAGRSGQLGGGTTDNIGDNEPASASAVVEIGGAIIALATGGEHTCVLVDGGDLYCWGAGVRGQLGYGNTLNVGDDEPPANAGVVPTNAAVNAVAAGGQHTCGVTLGDLMCWGAGNDGRLGYGNTSDVGDNELPAAVGTVTGPPETISLATGGSHTCAVDSSLLVYCWGLASSGQLGYGNVNNIGDTEVPAVAGVVNVGGQVTQVVAGDRHTCVLLDTAQVRCWGAGAGGRLGGGNENNIGDNETPSSVPPIDLGGAAVQLAAGGSHTCALLNNGAVRCWGLNDKGQLGYGHIFNIGDTEAPAVAGDVPLGAAATAITAGVAHSCALMGSGDVYCWGTAGSGQLGYGTLANIGDDETPTSAGPVPLD